MAGWSGLAIGLKTLLLGGAAVSAVSVAAVVWQAGPAPAPPPVPEEPEPVAAALAPTAPPPAAAPAEPDTHPRAAPARAAPAPPSFDVVRVEPDGAALVAGRAEAGQDVAVLIDGAQAALARADPQGRFVVFLTLATSTDARVMTLESRPRKGAAVQSSDRVLLAPSGSSAALPDPEPEAGAQAATTPPPAEAAPAEGEPVPAVAEAVAPVAEPVAPLGAVPRPAIAQAVAPLAQDADPPPVAPLPDVADAVASAGAVVVPAEPAAPRVPEVSVPAPMAPQTSVASAAPAPPSPPPQLAQSPAPIAAAPAAPTAILLSGDTVRVLQSPEGAVSPPGTISIDAIYYTASGAVALSGRGVAQAFVRLYLDNRALLETGIGPDGTWSGTLPALAPGLYTLRADQVSAEGQVTSRFETPFQREDPQVLAAPAAGEAAQAVPNAAKLPGKVSITVQPGFTLWQIARETYGDGMLFVRLYDANKTLIRDPDLIYPGQVFSVPQAD